MSNKILKSCFVPEKINLLNLNHKNLCHLFLKLGEPCFRAEQVMKWIYNYYCDDFMKMNNLKKKLRHKLNEIAVISPPKFKKKKNQLMER